ERPGAGATSARKCSTSIGTSSMWSRSVGIVTSSGAGDSTSRRGTARPRLPEIGGARRENARIQGTLAPARARPYFESLVVVAASAPATLMVAAVDAVLPVFLDLIHGRLVPRVLGADAGRV